AAILDHAVGLASVVGLEGLTIGRLAEDLKLSKSGLFAHFHSKEALQLQVLQAARSLYWRTVVRPTLRTSSGEPRVRAFVDRWIAWERHKAMPGGCVFMQAAPELDDRPG